MAQTKIITRATVAGIIKQGDKFLLTRRGYGRGMTFSGYWCFPGGRIEVGEGPIKGLVREIKEETGLTVLKYKFLFFNHYYRPKQKADYIELWFEVSKTKGQLKLQPGEVTESVWLTAQQVLKQRLAFTHRQCFLKYQN